MMKSEQTEFFKCLSDDTRLRMLHLLLSEHELCVCELMLALNLSQPLISRHLTTLRQCGIVEDERKGQWVYYRLTPNLPDWQLTVIQLSQLESSLYSNDLQRLHDNGASRPERQKQLCTDTELTKSCC